MSTDDARREVLRTAPEALDAKELADPIAHASRNLPMAAADTASAERAVAEACA